MRVCVGLLEFSVFPCVVSCRAPVSKCVCVRARACSSRILCVSVCCVVSCSCQCVHVPSFAAYKHSKTHENIKCCICVCLTIAIDAYSFTFIKCLPVHELI